MKFYQLFLLIILFYPTPSKGKIVLPALVGDHMILQQNKIINIWGYASPNAQILINFHGKHLSAITNQKGKWLVLFPPIKPGGPFEMEIKGDQEDIKLKDIYVGEVYLCSGQSNMEFNLKDALSGEKEVSQANYPMIRLFTVNKRLAFTPEDNLSGGKWSVCSPENAKYFSAVAYFFAKNLQAKIKIPIGLIDASWGGTVIESWISAKGLTNQPDFVEKLKIITKTDTSNYNQTHREIYQEWVKHFNQQDAGFKNGTYLWANPNLEDSDWKIIHLPTIWEFLGTPELINLDGVVWFKKEINLTQQDITNEALIDFGYIQNADEAFFNGQLIGKNGDDWGKRRAYLIPKNLLKVGKNIIVSRIENYGGDGGYRGKPDDFNLKTALRTISLEGDWKYKIGYILTKYDQPEKEFGPNTLPTILYNGMINPLINYSIRGVIWYQGESNWDRGYQYRDLFKRLINDWRAKFHQGDFPFLWVQLANHHEKLQTPADSYWAEIREAQSMALSLKNTGMITAIDLGNAANIHPKNKQEVGKRLALAAEKVIYHNPIIAWGPKEQSMKIKKNAIYIKFSGVGNGLHIEHGDTLKGFEIANADHQFKWAKAEIVSKNKVKVYLDNMLYPVAVRYAWEDNPTDANLYNSAHFPTFPFRTDDWKGITADHK